MTQTISDYQRLNDQICFPLYACAKEVVRRYRKPLEELNLTYTQYLVMMVLWESGGMTEGQLGRRIYLESGTLAPLLKRLEKAGYINRVRPENYENKLSVVFDDLPAARVTQDRVIEFVRNHPTVYCGTHTPQGYENLEAKLVMNLDDPVPTVLAEVDFSKSEASGKYVCSICGYVYDPAEHDGVAFEDLPDDWRCPRCKRKKEKFTAL